MDANIVEVLSNDLYNVFVEKMTRYVRRTVVRKRSPLNTLADLGVPLYCRFNAQLNEKTGKELKNILGKNFRVWPDAPLAEDKAANGVAHVTRPPS